MNIDKRDASKALFKQLRALPWQQLTAEIARFNQAAPRERMDRVSLIRAVSVVLAEAGTDAEKAEARAWLIDLLRDPEEKIRRYAMAALAKLEAGPEAEAALNALVGKTHSEREADQLAQALARVGGKTTLEVLHGSGALPSQAEQRLRARVARTQAPASTRPDKLVGDFARWRIHLRGRRGLEELIQQEVADQTRTRDCFRIEQVTAGLVVLRPLAPFSLADLQSLRCCGTVGFVLGTAPAAGAPDETVAIAGAIAGTTSRQLLESLTEGPIRYRLDFIGQGARRAAVREIAERVFAECPSLLNDPVEAPWEIDVYPGAEGQSVELRPKLPADARFAYRLDDVAAASHPPLAACLARLAGMGERDVVWDPFCGSGSELIERARLGGVRRMYGTDLSAEAIAISEANVAAANLGAVRVAWSCTDFRAFVAKGGLAAGSVDLVITNPPLGRRVHIPRLRELFEDLMEVAAHVLRPGGRLVLVNPLKLDAIPPALKRSYHRVVDLGGFDCALERYEKLK